MKLAQPGAVVHRAGRSWFVRPGHSIPLLDGDVIEQDGRRQIVDLDEEDDPAPACHRPRARAWSGAAALALTAFLGLTSSPVSAQTPAPSGNAAPARRTPEKPAARKARPTGRISGRVVIARSRKPVSLVHVVLADSSGKELARHRTGDQGEFEFFDLPPGRYRVQVGREPLAAEPYREVTVARGVTRVTLETHEDTLKVQTTSGF